MGIEMVQVRSAIVIGSIRVGTPGDFDDGMVISFNVKRERGRPASFNASIKVKHDVLNNSSSTLGDIVIEAGVEGNLNKIFTGIIKNAKVAPCNDDPSYVMLSLSGFDKLILLEGKKYTRRNRGTKVSWATIDGVVRKGLKDSKFKYKTDVVNIHHAELGDEGGGSKVIRSASITSNFFNEKIDPQVGSNSAGALKVTTLGSIEGGG